MAVCLTLHCQYEDRTELAAIYFNMKYLLTFSKDNAMVVNISVLFYIPIFSIYCTIISMLVLHSDQSHSISFLSMPQSELSSLFDKIAGKTLIHTLNYC